MASHLMKAADLVNTTSGAVRSLITSGRLPPGAPVSERLVAARLGVSRGTARGALRLLSQEGFVRSSSPGRYSRFRVAPLTAADLTDLTILMAAIDSAGARLAAALDPIARARLVIRLKAINDKLAAALAKGDQRAAREYDAEFHRTYVARAAGARHQGEHRLLEPELTRYALTYQQALSGVSVAGHRRIIMAIAAGRGAAAQAAAEQNWLDGLRRAVQEVAVIGERGSW
ncbi:MAG TPA: GntR family transcriptional regulator [Gemmatimonadales bacterium]|nr:GntR family transcriptional regulator [Gemmatimonadales bacterium]